ncbi:MAG: helix-turn-helix transcriptional regulator [Paludibacteraceae bacterium]|nr:helix-turn-helix transcriptional regulator [Paludibacteraceae bacterium]MBO5989061.1 helix-turn-helix transcriptional regulator [Paludibacteraceae bacterium]
MGNVVFISLIVSRVLLMLMSLVITVVLLVNIFQEKERLPNYSYGKLILAFNFLLAAFGYAMLGQLRDMFMNYSQYVNFFNIEFMFISALNLSLVHLAFIVLLVKQERSKYPLVAKYLWPLGIIFLLFLYFRAVVHPSSSVELHMTSFGDYVDNITHPRVFIGVLTFVVFFFHCLRYMFFFRRAVKFYDKQIYSNYSNVEGLNTNWIKKIYFILQAHNFVSLVLGFYFNVYMLVLFFVSVLIMCPFIVRSYLDMESVFQFKRIANDGIDSEDEFEEQDAIVGEEEQLQNRLAEVMVSSQIFLRSNLTLDELSLEMGMSKKALSSFLNNRLNQNFYFYVNSFRIDKARNLLQSSDLSIKEIAFECGFVNDSHFNRIFKQHVGITPKQFRQNENVAEAS